MKLSRIFLIVLLHIAFSIGLTGQEPPKARLFDEFGIVCSEALLGRYDYFISTLNSEPSAKGLVLFYGDRTTEGRNLALYHYMSSFYPRVRQLKDLNLEFVRGINQTETKIQFWIIPAGAGDPRSVETYKLLPVTSTTRFDVARGDFHKVAGKTELYYSGFYELGCDFGPNNVGFIDLLRKNDSLTGFLVIYTEFGKGKSHGDRVAKFAVNELLKNFRISRTRIKTVYGGNRNNAEVELWLVPEGNPMPALRPHKPATSN